MITVLLLVWLGVVMIQLVFILVIFAKTAFYHPPNRVSLPEAVAQPVLAGRPRAGGPENSTDEPDPAGVTIIVCARNEYDNLTELLPLLNGQHYPTFEVLVMDDRSTDGTKSYLENGIAHLSRVRFLRIDKEHGHITPKKYALTIAIKKALYPTVLLTDADCRPASTDWLAGMVAPLSDAPTDLVLGFSPYEWRPGLLNLLIRSETLFTAVQYVSLALAGRPYMGVGRNLAYRTRTFFNNRGFYTHKNVLGGDDDLFVNEVATPQNTAVCLDPDTFTWSKPKETWADWRLQKRRHLHVGRYYRSAHKRRLGLLMGSYVLSWTLGLAAGLVCLVAAAGWFSFPAPEWLLLQVATGAFGLRWLAYWAVVGRISYRLGHTVHWALMPAVDVLLAVYYGLAGLQSVFVRKPKRYYWR